MFALCTSPCHASPITSRVTAHSLPLFSARVPSPGSRFTSWKLPPHDPSPSAFNNISVQFLPAGSAALPADDDAEFWALPYATEGRYVAPVEGDA